MTKRMILAENMEKGIAIVAVEEKLYAYTNGKYYSTRDFRPVNGDGRQLRDDSREVIKSLMPEAMEAMEAAKAAEKAAIDAAIAAMPQPEAPRTNFADALQDAFLKTLTEKAASDLTAEVFPIVEKMLVDKFGLIPVVHEIRLPERKSFETTEILHEKFDLILQTLLCDISVYLHGPAGTGKSYLAQQLAKAMELNYYYTNAVTDEVQLKGFIDANGHFHETEFYKAFTQGGIFLLDELDGSIPETALTLNNALANKYFPFPTGNIPMHKDFHCIATGNTIGTGADNVYNGRTQLDAATMNRFVSYAVGYDERIEIGMAANDKTLVDFAHDFRNAVEKVGSHCLFTYRNIKFLATLSGFMDKSEAIEAGLTKGLAADDCGMIYRNLLNRESDWAKALKKLSEK